MTDKFIKKRFMKYLKNRPQRVISDSILNNTERMTGKGLEFRKKMLKNFYQSKTLDEFYNKTVQTMNAL